MKLVERDQLLAELDYLYQRAVSENGYIVAISGEAGIGKTSLVEYYTGSYGEKVRVFSGSCDDLYTPRPLAPLYDIVGKLNSRIINQLDSGTTRPSIFSNILKEIKAQEPCIIVIEDVHWADESTLDFIKFLGRRINDIRALFIITFRDDELQSNHPLKLLFSTLPTGLVKRIKLGPLSKEAVNRMAVSYGREDLNLYTKTGGNPLLVTEVLLNDGTGTPATIKDLIQYKLSRLSSASRYAVELISVIPGKVERWLLKMMFEDLDSIDEALTLGILKYDDDAILFKHELVRIAVEESLSEKKRIELNSFILGILLKQKTKEHFYARIIHHAAKAGESDIIIKYVPAAAKQASELGAHKQAVKHYFTALEYSDKISVEEHLNLLEGSAYECYMVGQVEAGVRACESILKILKKFPDPGREGEVYRVLSTFMWHAGEEELTEQYLYKSVSILEKLSPSRHLAMAYSNLSSIYAHRNKSDFAFKYGETAIGLAKSLNDLETEAHSLNNIGLCKMRDGDESGEQYLKESLQLSLDNELYEHAARAYCNLGAKYLWQRNLPEAEKYLSKGLEYSTERDIDSIRSIIAGDYAKAKLYSGQWDGAIELSNIILKSENVPAANKIFPLCVIGQIRTRRMDPGALKLLDEADYLALKVGEIDRIVTVKSARAEYYWLQNDLNVIVNELEAVYKNLKNSKYTWAVGEIAYWLWKSGRQCELPDGAANPFILQIQGRWKEAADVWKHLRCPYEQALAFSEGDEEAMLSSITIFNELGASAGSQLIKQKMRVSGIRNVPKGPRQSTKKNPAGLTNRQFEVLRLIAKGLGNSEIADNLYISAKTVDHHISAIFTKLNIHSRIEAASYLHSVGDEQTVKNNKI